MEGPSRLCQRRKPQQWNQDNFSSLVPLADLISASSRVHVHPPPKLKPFFLFPNGHILLLPGSTFNSEIWALCLSPHLCSNASSSPAPSLRVTLCPDNIHWLDTPEPLLYSAHGLGTGHIRPNTMWALPCGNTAEWKVPWKKAGWRTHQHPGDHLNLTVVLGEIWVVFWRMNRSLSDW